MFPKPLNTKQPYQGPVLCSCKHCGDLFGAGGGTTCALTCKECRSEPQRQAQHQENKLIMGEQWKCKICK